MATTTRSRTVLLLAVAVVSMWPATAAGAAPNPDGVADCPAATVTVAAVEVRRGSTVDIGGYGWTACNDVGGGPTTTTEPPAETVEVHIVQGDTRILVAGGFPGRNGRFEANVTIPSELEPGPAAIEARKVDSGYEPPSVSIDVLDAPPIGPGGQVAEFGRNDEADRGLDGSPNLPTGDTGSERGWPAASISIAAVAAAAALLGARRARTRDDPAPDRA